MLLKMWADPRKHMGNVQGQSKPPTPLLLALDSDLTVTIAACNTPSPCWSPCVCTYCVISVTFFYTDPQENQFDF